MSLRVTESLLWTQLSSDSSPLCIPACTRTFYGPRLWFQVLVFTQTTAFLGFWGQLFHSPLSLSSRGSLVFFTFCHKGGVIWISEVIDISPSNLDSSLCFFQPSVSHDVHLVNTISGALQGSRTSVFSLCITNWLTWLQRHGKSKIFRVSWRQT